MHNVLMPATLARVFVCKVLDGFEDIDPFEGVDPFEERAVGPVFCRCLSVYRYVTKGHFFSMCLAVRSRLTLLYGEWSINYTGLTKKHMAMYVFFV